MFKFVRKFLCWHDDEIYDFKIAVKKTHEMQVFEVHDACCTISCKKCGRTKNFRFRFNKYEILAQLNKWAGEWATFHGFKKLK